MINSENILKDVWKNGIYLGIRNSRGGFSLVCKERCRFSTGWCMREPYCPLCYVVCDATIPTLPLFEMAKSACSPFSYVLHYLLSIKFISSCCSTHSNSTFAC